MLYITQDHSSSLHIDLKHCSRFERLLTYSVPSAKRLRNAQQLSPSYDNHMDYIPFRQQGFGTTKALTYIRENMSIMLYLPNTICLY
jgi:hypothetical protein